MKQKLILKVAVTLVGIALFAVAGCGSTTTTSTTQASDAPTDTFYGVPKTVLNFINATPSNGQININPTTTVTVNFNTNIDPGTVNASNIRVERTSDNTVVTGAYTINGFNVIFTPTAPLAGTYKVTISSLLRSSTGGALSKGLNYSFTTLNAIDIIPPTLATSVTSYSNLDSTQAGGPTFAYEDISTTGSDIVTLHVDDTFDAITLPFPVSIFGDQYTTLYVGTNGYITAGVGDGTYTNYSFPSSGLPRIAPYFDDLWPLAAPNGILYQIKGTAPNRRLVVQWYNLEHYDTRGDGKTVNFEVTMYENSTDILFQYLNVNNFSNSGAARAKGASATVGLNKGDGVTAVQYSFNSPLLKDGLAILFTEKSAQSPLPGSLNVPVNATINTIFSEALQPASIISPASTFSVATSGIPITGTVTYSGGTATFTPSSNLLPNTVYTVTIGTGVKDTSNNPLSAPITWSFTTAA